MIQMNVLFKKIFYPKDQELHLEIVYPVTGARRYKRKMMSLFQKHIIKTKMNRTNLKMIHNLMMILN
jgi:hypothetical protein